VINSLYFLSLQLKNNSVSVLQSTRGDKPQVTDRTGEGTEGTFTLLKWDRGVFFLLNCFYLFIKVEGNEGGIYTHLFYTAI
jgi:hypothetical protein